MAVDQGNEQRGPSEIRSELKKYDLEPIPYDALLHTLGLEKDIVSEELKTSVRKSAWYSTDNGRVIVEIRNHDKLKNPPQGLLYISDLDDTLFGATAWHNEEFRRLSTDPKLRKRGINFFEDQGRDLYDHSKMTLPGIGEPRYTPLVNTILDSIYAWALEKGQPPEQAREATLSAFNRIKDDIASNGESCLDNYPLDEDVVECLLGNHTVEFVYEHFAKYFLEGTEERSTRAMVTRGKIEGPFGQVYKVHTAGVLDRGLGTDVVLYTNDLKADALPILYQLFPNAVNNGTRIFDDNPTEVDKYVSWAGDHGVRNWEVIRVIHPGIKRVNFLGSNKPDTTWGKGDIRYELYRASPDAPKTDLPTS